MISTVYNIRMNKDTNLLSLQLNKNKLDRYLLDMANNWNLQKYHQNSPRFLKSMAFSGNMLKWNGSQAKSAYLWWSATIYCWIYYVTHDLIVRNVLNIILKRPYRFAATIKIILNFDQKSSGIQTRNVYLLREFASLIWMSSFADYFHSISKHTLRS